MGQEADETDETDPDRHATAKADATGTPAGSISAGGETAEKATEIELVRFDLLRCALYHDISQHWLGRIHRGLTFLMIVLGSGAIAGFGASYPIVGQAAGALIAVIGAASLVWGFGESAVLHADLRRRYYGLLAELERGADMADVKARMTTIYSDEPPVSNRINKRAHNQAGQSLFGDDFNRA
ncbi:hypothetical protein [Pontibaca salina]|uniref:Uncharacterized protein n=1 Tax=Pontibaca salina TaxID=2795731 RepID=A0A934HHP4_9RHOB|nr:hypothetical protein [Pontibaca salina]MBI6628353.1 hypothetical protein [Pontibaca salina]